MTQQSLTLGERTFTAADQRAFGALSRDVNPMHMDEVAARRLISGRQVVHGVHTLLQALDLWRPEQGLQAAHVQCNFDQPISVGDRVVFTHTMDADGAHVLVAAVEGLACTVVTLTCAAPDRPDAAPAPAADADADADADAEALRRIDSLPAPLDEAPGSQSAHTLVLPPWGHELATTYPQAARVLSPQALSALGRLSYYVGMVCPGLHSVFSSLQFTPGAQPPASEDLSFRLKRYDPRFKLFIVDYQGPIQGQLRAFLRPPPQPQPSTRELQAHVQPGEFKGTRALVIGGSRGLGEMTAKLLAAGGGDVVVSYAQGRADALRVAEDVAAAGAGACDTLALDLSQQDFASIDLAGELDAVYFFATPRIFRKKADTFDKALFAEFAQFYLERFAQLCRWLETRPGDRPVKVYLPSTVFITERPKGMTEYAMAKAAAEVLADDLNRTLQRVRVVHTRLPRLATDQTASIMGVSVASNVDTLLPVVRQVSGQSAAA
jgi:acyl dehydratase/NAD(P)-dependent dehydrogenase (short-subunit alcohol dehydrogenase family)